MSLFKIIVGFGMWTTIQASTDQLPDFKNLFGKISLNIVGSSVLSNDKIQVKTLSENTFLKAYISQGNGL